MTLRRDFLAMTAGAVAAKTVLPLAAGAETLSASRTRSSPDALLIETCFRFAEADWESWYRYCTAPDDVADEQDTPADTDTLHWIVATPATTPEGWHAKALAAAAWNRAAYDDPEDDRDGVTPIIAALLRDMVAPARNAILTRLQAKYGPLSEGYTPDWRWMGRPRS
jgi:hypothetical protein